MKHFILIVSVMLPWMAYSQGNWQINFCNELDSTGQCTGNNSVFNWDGEKATITALISNDAGLGATKLVFKVFDMKNDHTGDLYAELRSATKAEWKTTTKKINFVKPGYYKVEVYDEANKRLTDKYLTVTERN